MHPLQPVWESLQREFDAACTQRARKVSEAATTQLHQLLRRFRDYQGEAEWLTILLDGANLFAPEVAVFQINGKVLNLRAQRGMKLADDLALPVSQAFAGVVDSRDPLMVLRACSEVGEALAAPNGRARLIPIVNGQRVVAILFAADEKEQDGNALELVAGIASMALERQANTELHAQVARQKTPVPSASSEARPAWNDLSEAEQTLHLRAQRFSRVSVAEMQMARPEACAAGREASNVYLFMQGEIDRARDSYRKQFMVIPSMVDYLHLEIARVIADNDPAALGAEYPGAMV